MQRRRERIIEAYLAAKRREARRRVRAEHFTCPECGMTSYHPNDIRERYCGNCNVWTGVPR
jgi:hypothetical protein